MTAVLEVRGMDVPFGDAPGLTGISLEVRDGGRLALVGPSGSGKTSLLRALAGTGPITSGSTWVGGTDVTALPPDRRSTVLLSQRPLLFPHMSVFENVAFPLRVRGVKEGEVTTRVEEALASVRMADLAGRAPAALSGGQAHRVALARAVVARPRVLLLDEPLNALDPTLREDVRRTILDVQARFGPAMVLVTHDLEEAGRSADRVAVLMEGTLAQIGTPEEIFRRPASAAVARFLGLPNELPGVLDENGGLTVAGWATGTVWPMDGHPAADGQPGPKGDAREVTVIFGVGGARIARPGTSGLPGRVLAVLHHPRGVTVRIAVQPPRSRPHDDLAGSLVCEVATGPGHDLKPGQDIAVVVDPRGGHVFASGGRLAGPPV